MSHQSRDPQEVRAARRPGPPGRGGGASGRSRASTTSPSTSTRRSSTCSPRCIDGMNEGGGIRRRRRGRRAPARRRNGDGDGETATAPTWRPCSAIMELCWGDVGLLLTMPRQGLGNSAIAAVANDEQLERFERQVGRDGDHRAGGGLATRPRSAPPRCSTATSTCSTARRSTSPPASAPTSSSSGRRSTAAVGRAAIKSFVVERSNPGMKLDRARAQARHPRLGHRGVHPRRLPRAEGEPARHPGDRRQEGLRRRHADVRQHAAAGRRDGGRRRARVPRADARAARPRPASRSTTTARRTRRPPRRPSCSRWRPTTRPRAC